MKTFSLQAFIFYEHSRAALKICAFFSAGQPTMSSNVSESHAVSHMMLEFHADFNAFALGDFSLFILKSIPSIYLLKPNVRSTLELI